VDATGRLSLDALIATAKREKNPDQAAGKIEDIPQYKAGITSMLVYMDGNKAKLLAALKAPVDGDNLKAQLCQLRDELNKAIRQVSQ
jgi:hypothetical protein